MIKRIRNKYLIISFITHWQYLANRRKINHGKSWTPFSVQSKWKEMPILIVHVKYNTSFARVIATNTSSEWKILRLKNRERTRASSEPHTLHIRLRYMRTCALMCLFVCLLIHFSVCLSVCALLLWKYFRFENWNTYTHTRIVWQNSIP